MKTDSIFYQLFQTFPRCFFDLLNLPANTVNEYQFSSVEIKQLSFRKEAIEQGKGLIQQVKEEFNDTKQQENILQLIETILVYKLPLINRKEIEKMFSLSDLRETKVYQEALEEGIEQGRQEGELVAKIASIPRLVVLGLSVEQIAQALDLDIEQVRKNVQSN